MQLIRQSGRATVRTPTMAVAAMWWALSVGMAFADLTSGVDGSLALARDVKPFVAVGRTRCVEGRELGALLREVSAWSQSRFVGRRWDTVLRGMREANVSQKGSRTGGGTEDRTYFRYTLWEEISTNTAMRVTVEVEFEVELTEPSDEAQHPPRIVGCKTKMIAGGCAIKNELVAFMSALGLDLSTLSEHATFKSAVKAYPALARFEMTYEPLKSRWEEYWPYGFTGQLSLQALSGTNHAAILDFKAVTDYDHPISADGKPSPDMKAVIERYRRLHGRVECDVIREN